MRWFPSLAAVLALAVSPAAAAPPGDSPDASPPDSLVLDASAPEVSSLILDTAFDRRFTPVSSSGAADALRYPPLPPEPAFPSRFGAGPPSTLDLLSGGIQGGLAGALVGGGFAYAVQATTDDSEKETTFTGALIGWTMGSTVGMHLANRREGNLAVRLAASFIPAAAFSIFAVTSDSEGLIIPFAVFQLGMGIVTAPGTRGDGPR